MFGTAQPPSTYVSPSGPLIVAEPEGEPGLETPVGLLDMLVFGDADSEQAHAVKAENSESVVGALAIPARQLLPPQKAGWEGGHVAFALDVDPEVPNYVTVRLWGSDTNVNRLMLFCGGRQVGYRHLGDIDVLDAGGTTPFFNGRFFYNTLPLPTNVTSGRVRVNLQIRSSGPIQASGTDFAQYQKPMQGPTRGLYRIYTHTESCFVPPPEEKQGEVPLALPTRQAPGAEVMEQLKERVRNEITALLATNTPPDPLQMQFLAKAYFVDWTPAARNPKVLETVTKGADALFLAYQKDSRVIEVNPETDHAGSLSLGPAANAIRLLAGPLDSYLKLSIRDNRNAILSRRATWSEMLRASRRWHRSHRSRSAVSGMINDWSSYAANAAVEAINPELAEPATNMLRYLHESVGLHPWLGNETEKGPEKPLGDSYFVVSAKGLGRDFGFTGHDGELLDRVVQMYDVTRMPGETGDLKIKGQLQRIAAARAIFRYPLPDAEGNRAMRMETVIGWNDTQHPGDVCYAQAWDGSALSAAATTLDGYLLGYVQQMFADNQFFASLAAHMQDPGFRTTAGLLDVPDQYEAIRALPPTGQRLPMSVGKGGDFVFTDELTGVVAIKRGDEILYAALHWRARQAINFLGRVHYITPRFDRVAVVRVATEFEPSGLTHKRPDWVNLGFGDGGPRYPGILHSLHAGEELPIAKIPEGEAFQPGDENEFAGKGEFYSLRYGNYLIGMNCGTNKAFTLQVPRDAIGVRELVANSSAAPGGTVTVHPQSTRVLWFDR
ncbi:MAG: hypothetical protein O3B24_10250 [Verrucomicrobia bacterium]|nr:hypothetical protein [Verrucomicrobiota bacterium]